MREITVDKIAAVVAELFEEAQYNLPEEVVDAVNEALAFEKSETAREILREIIKNSQIAMEKKIPLCQDTGTAFVFIKLGQEVKIIDGNLYDAVNAGVVMGYKNMRKSIVSDPLYRENTNDNSPAEINIEIVPGDKIKIIVMPKGGGAENASIQKMLLPTVSKEELKNFIVKNIVDNASKACPPVIVGIGIGGSFSSVASLSKKALLRPVKSHSTKHHFAEMEKEILKEVNASGIGPMGLSGNTTALAVHIESAPCHIASLPVSINFQCHSHRFKEKSI